jgi:acyl-CoA thioester hydrolase
MQTKNPSPQPSGTLLHNMRFPIRWGELDVLGHVNNAQYLRYFEESRTAWCESIGRPLRNTGEGMILLKASVTYKKPVGYPATVSVELRAGRIGNTSFDLINMLSIEGESGVAASGEFVIVWFDYVNNKPKSVPAEIRELLIKGKAEAAAETTR